MESNFYILLVIILIANIVEAISGFGSTIISVTLGSNFFDIEFLLSIIVPLNLVLSSYIVLKYFKYIDTDFLVKKILPFMGTGLVAGIYIFSTLKSSNLKLLYSLVIILLSLKELYSLSNPNKNLKVMSEKQSSFWMLMSGVMQGVYASGGPLLVYSMTSRSFPKTVFRSNLSVVWLVSNTILSITYLTIGKMNLETIKYSSYLFPVLLIGIIIGEKLHHKIDEVIFKKSVYILLMLAGMSLLKSSFN